MPPRPDPRAPFLPRPPLPPVPRRLSFPVLEMTGGSIRRGVRLPRLIRWTFRMESQGSRGFRTTPPRVLETLVGRDARGVRVTHASNQRGRSERSLFPLAQRRLALPVPRIASSRPRASLQTQPGSLRLTPALCILPHADCTTQLADLPPYSRPLRTEGAGAAAQRRRPTQTNRSSRIAGPKLVVDLFRSMKR